MECFKKAVLAGMLMVLGVVAPFSARTLAYTCPTDSARPGAVVDTPSLCGVPITTDNAGTEVSAPGAATNVINVLTGLVAFVMVVIIIIAAIQFITSQGDSGKVAKARNAILYAVIGLVVAILAYAIVNFVLTAPIFKTT